MSNRVRGTSTLAEWDANRAEVKAEAAEVVKANAEKAAADLLQFRKGQGYPAPTVPADLRVNENAGEQESEEEAGPYDGWTNDQLSDELELRGLPKSGNKDELLARLAEADAAAEKAPE